MSTSSPATTSVKSSRPTCASSTGRRRTGRESPSGRPLLDVDVAELAPADLPSAARVLGRSYRDNPLSIALLGGDPAIRERVNEALMAIRLEAMARRPLCVRSRAGLVGVCGFEGPEGLDMTDGQRQRMATVLSEAGPGTIPKLAEMLSEFAKRTPSGRFWKLGPVAVDPGSQGGGIGSAMVARFCERLDELGEVACLDTDQAGNVRLYEKFGFEVTAQGPILGVHTWFMTRRPR